MLSRIINWFKENLDKDLYEYYEGGNNYYATNKI